MSTRYDAEVIVVGAGPAGAATAAFLSRAGLDVLLLDRARFPRPKPCAEYLSPQAGRLLEELGVLGAVEALPHARLTGMQIVAPSGTAFTGSFAEVRGFRGFRSHGIACRRELLDATLVQRARRAGAQLREGTTVIDLPKEGEQRKLVVRDREGVRTLSAPLIVGADGLRSVVARRLGLSRSARWPRRYAVVAHFSGVQGVDELGEMHVFADGYVGLANVGGGITNVAIVVPHRQRHLLQRGTQHFLEQWLAARPQLQSRFGTAAQVGEISATGPFAHYTTAAWLPGAALVGDAADFFDPFTGEGIYTALRGAELLTPYAFEVARATSASRAATALAAYGRARQHAFGGKWRIERLIGLSVEHPFLLNWFARRLASRREMANLLVGVAGDFVPPEHVLSWNFVRRLFVRSSPGLNTRSAAPVLKP